MQFQAVLFNQQHPEYGVATIPFPIKNEDYAATLELLEPLEIGDAVQRDCRIEEIRNGVPVLKQMELTDANLDELDYLKLPSSPAEIGEAFAELDAISTDTSATKITEAISNIYNLSGYLKNVDIEKPGELDKLSALARRMQTMDRDSCYLFEGVLDANRVTGLDDILRLSESLTDYTLLPDAANASTLGKYLVQHEIVRFPESVQPYLDYQIIGSEFYADHGGAFCRGGYAVRKDELPERFLQTEQEKNQRSVMLLRLRASHGGQQAPADTTLTLPASDDELDRTKQRLGIDEFAEAEIVTVDYVFPYFSTMVPQDEATVEDANELAHYIEQMSHKDGELASAASPMICGRTSPS